MSEPSFVLDAYAARSCELKTVNAFTPGLVAPQRETRLPGFFHDAGAVEEDVFGRLRSGSGTIVDLRGLRGAASEEQETAALRALADGVDLIVSPLLPRDWDAHRAGRPSLLVRLADGYVPVLVKFHRVLETCSIEQPGVQVSTLDDPLALLELPGRRFRWSSRLRAALQVAHHWRLLEKSGYAASRARAGLIGTERLTPPGSVSRSQRPVITWLDLDAPLAAPGPDAAPGPASVSTLARYDDEHARRVELASGALGATPGWTPPAPVVHRECTFCPWSEICAARLPDDDLSRAISKAPLDPHEIRTLRALGVASVTDLARADLDALLVGYLPQVEHREGGEGRLRLAQRRARLIASGVELERTSAGPLALPRHDLEIDLDIETSAGDHAYLWGFHVDDLATGVSGYQGFGRFEHLDAAGERALAAEAFAWLRSVTAGRDAAVYHYSDYEVLRIQRLAAGLREKGLGPVDAEGRDPDEPAALADWICAFAEDRFIDLFPVVKGHFFGANGLGLKVVASAGAGFHWRDDTPGGLASQTWFSDAVDAPTASERDAARTRVLEYNEDDVRATWHLRAWLRTLP